MNAFHRLAEWGGIVARRAAALWTSTLGHLARRWRRVFEAAAVVLLIGVAFAMGLLWPLAIGIVAVLVVVGAVLLWWWVPKWQMQSVTTGDPQARADIEDNFRKTVGQALGGVFVLFGAGVAYLQFLQQQQAAHDLLISNQVAKAFEQLAGRETVMRLGGIYALEGVMKTSNQYHQPVLEALCAFVRDSTIGMVINEKPATDTQAALTVIGRRPPGDGRVDLAFARIPKGPPGRGQPDRR